MPRYLDPKNDLVFKKIFGEHPDLLMDFLNAVLPLPDDGLISELVYLSPEQVPATPLSYRRSIVDVKCRDQQGRTFIVEMQLFWTTTFQQRMLFTASQAYVYPSRAVCLSGRTGRHTHRIHFTQEPFFSYRFLEERIPKDHPLRKLRAMVDILLATMNSEFNALYARIGRASIPV